MAKYKYKISEMSKKASADEAEKELGIPKSRFEVGQVSFSKDGTSKSTITDIDPVTGAVRWEITQLPGFDKLYDDLTDLVNTAKRTYVKTKDDKKFRDFYDEIRVIRNKVRTHLRNEYPDQYKRITRIGEMFSKDILDLDKKIKEDDVDEISTSAGAGAYLTPYAFRLKGQKPDDEAYTQLGYKPVKEVKDGGSLFDYFAKKGYKVTERSPDGREAGFEGYMVSKGDGPYPQSVIFQYNKDNDQFKISRMGGYRIDQKEAIRAGMRQQGYSGVAGRDSYITDGNYTPKGISVEGLKIAVDHVMGGLEREADAQADFYARRGPVSGTIDEKIRLAVEKKLTAAEKRKKEDIIMALKKQKGGKKKLKPVDYAIATDRAKKLAEEFKVGQKITYLGNPGEITKVDKDIMDRVYYNVLYDKGTGKTKATNIYNKDGEIKALEEIGMFNDPIGYRKSKPEPEVFDKKYVAKDTYDILKHGKKLMTFFGSEGEANAYINKLTSELK